MEPEGIDPGPHAVLDDENESTCTKFADDAKLGSEVDTSERRAILQGHLNRLEDWASKNCMKLNKTKCKKLHLVWNNQKPQYRLGSVCMGNSLADRDLGFLVDNKLNLNQQCVSAATKVKWTLGYISRGI